MKLLVKTIAIAALFTGLQVPDHTKAATPTGKTCSIQSSFYRAIGNPDFQLVFAPPPPNKIMGAVVSLTHTKRGQIQAFHLTTANGYGSSSLLDPKGARESLNIVFFDRDLKRDGIFRNQHAPEYVFIAGLGSSDYYYYSSNGDNRKFLLGDVMWRFDRCGQ